MDEKQTEKRQITRTRFDRSRQHVTLGILIAGGVLVAALIATAIVLSAQGASGDSRAITANPRAINIWVVNPDSTVRFVTIIHPDPYDSATLIPVAGPLVYSEDGILSAEAVGGKIDGQTLLTGPGHDSAYVYEEYLILQEELGDPYGVDVLVRSVPYIADDVTQAGYQTISLGTVPQAVYEQMLVAVALPHGTDISTNSPDSAMEFLAPYRSARAGAWDVYYFDVTAVEGTEVIRLTFDLAESDRVRDFDYWKVDLRR